MGADVMLATLEDAYGGRPALADQLSTLTDPRAIKVAHLLADPKWSGQSLSDLCKACDVAPSSMLMLLRDGALARAVASAHLQFQRRLPEVVDSVSHAAIGGLSVCKCTVGGQVGAQPDCPQCRGTGHAYTAPSLPHQELVLDVLGVTPKAGPSVSVTTNVQANVAVGNIFDAFVKGNAKRPITIDAVAIKE